MALTVREFESAEGTVPFRDWLATLDRRTRARIQARVLRFETGTSATTRALAAAFRKRA
jgi:putative component of toxin-antitoxin plasmid stabilization module